MTRKLFTCAIVTVVASCLAYLAGAWVVIYGLKPEHPEVAPHRLFAEALAQMPVLIVSLTIFQLIAFACVAHRIANVPVGYIVSIVAEVSGIVALAHGLLSELESFDSPIQWWLIAGNALVVILSSVVLIYFRTRHAHAIAT